MEYKHWTHEMLEDVKSLGPIYHEKHPEVTKGLDKPLEYSGLYRRCGSFRYLGPVHKRDTMGCSSPLYVCGPIYIDSLNCLSDDGDYRNPDRIAHIFVYYRSMDDIESLRPRLLPFEMTLASFEYSLLMYEFKLAKKLADLGLFINFSCEEAPLMIRDYLVNQMQYLCRGNGSSYKE